MTDHTGATGSQAESGAAKPDGDDVIAFGITRRQLSDFMVAQELWRSANPAEWAMIQAAAAARRQKCAYSHHEGELCLKCGTVGPASQLDRASSPSTPPSPEVNPE